MMKWVKRAGLAVISLPALLIAFFVLYELLGMCVNHIATGRQTAALRRNLEAEIPDIQIVEVYSETGNTSGTGNHVDCLTSIIFSTKAGTADITDRLSLYYAWDEWCCYITELPDGNYRFYLNTPAPFPDNIEGH